MTRESSADFPIFSIPGPIHAENDWTVTEKGSIITTVSEHDQSHRENITDDVHQPSEDCRYVNDSQTNDRGNLNQRTTVLQTNGQLEYYPGISTERPKHPDYGIKSVRLSSFTNWNQGIVDPTQLAEAGFFYTGDRDCVTCFFCGGGMKGWEEGDNPWIEHARWFPNCSFVKQCKGDNFVNMCRMANINYMSANGQMENFVLSPQNIESNEKYVDDQQVEDLNSTAAKLVRDMGYGQEDLENAIKCAREKYGSSELRAQYILESLLDNSYRGSKNIPSGAHNTGPTNPVQQDGYATNADSSTVKSSEQQALLDENLQLKNQMTCKICMDKDACVVFLPCGHMVSCVECAFALRKCAICRTLIQGTIRTYLA